MKVYILICTLIISAQSYGQQFKNNVGAPFIGLSAYNQNSSILGLQSNAATLGFIKKSGAGVFAERRFGLAELNNSSIVGGLHTKAGGIGIQINRFGSSGFNETQMGLGYGKALSNKISVGAKINYYSQQIPQYGNSSTINAEAGVLLRLTNKLTSGLSVYNPTGGKFGVNDSEKLASVYKLGLGYEVSNKVAIASEIVKTENEPLNFIGMVFYQFEEKFYAKAGVSTAANNFFASAGLRLGTNFRLEISASHHQQLGFTPGITLVLE